MLKLMKMNRQKFTSLEPKLGFPHPTQKHMVGLGHTVEAGQCRFHTDQVKYLKIYLRIFVRKRFVLDPGVETDLRLDNCSGEGLFYWAGLEV